jgi:hypothetical protein
VSSCLTREMVLPAFFYDVLSCTANAMDRQRILTNFMELGLSGEAANYAATQELPRNLWNPNVHYRVHKSPPLVPTLSQINPVHTTHPLSLRPVLIVSTHLPLGLPSGLLPSGFTINILHAFLSSPFVLHVLPISSSYSCKVLC